MRLLLSALECDIDTSPRLPSNAAGIYIKMSLNGGCVVTLYKSNKAHRLNKMWCIPLISFFKNYLDLPVGIKKLQLVSLAPEPWCLFIYLYSVDAFQMVCREVSTRRFGAATLLCPHIPPGRRLTPSPQPKDSPQRWR